MGYKHTYWIFRIIRALAWLIFPKFKLSWTENLPDEPCIIVGNHSQANGPVAAELYTPVSHYTWCIGEMMKWNEVAPYAFQDFWSGKPKAIRWFYKILSYIITPISVVTFNNARTIPVYHDARLITTFRQSVEKLQEGSSIVIFPEHYDEHNNIVHDFQDKFVDLARFFYKKTGKEISFVPLYIAPRLSLMTYGKPIRFHADAPIADERRRICDALMDGITEIAVSLPEHTVVPYPNIAKKDYPKNLPLKDYTHEKTTS